MALFNHVWALRVDPELEEIQPYIDVILMWTVLNDPPHEHGTSQLFQKSQAVVRFFMWFYSGDIPFAL